MNEIPMWWLILSALFFATNAILVGALAFAMFKLGNVVMELKPKVEALVEKVDGVTTKVDSLTTTIQSTVSNVGHKAEGIAGSASSMALTTSKVFEKYAPILGIVLTGMKLLSAFTDFKKRNQPHPHDMEA